MILWKDPSDFSQEFLERYHPIILFDHWHRIKTLLLYPERKYEETRAKILLSLHVDFFYKERKENNDPAYIAALKYILQIPDESYLAQNYTQAYPIWLIEENLKRKAEEKHFQIVACMVWTLLRLAQTYKDAGYPYTEASVKQALEIILGKTPLRSKAKKHIKDEYLCGEKGFIKYFNLYKPVCHFVAAYEYLREESGNSINSIITPEDIRRFLSLAYWFRQQLLLIEIPNVKSKTLFSKNMPISLPSWVKTQEANIIIEPIEDKLKELKEKLENAPLYSRTSEYHKKK